MLKSFTVLVQGLENTGNLMEFYSKNAKNLSIYAKNAKNLSVKTDRQTDSSRPALVFGGLLKKCMVPRSPISGACFWMETCKQKSRFQSVTAAGWL